jgi:hypothetical protein
LFGFELVSSTTTLHSDVTPTSHTIGSDSVNLTFVLSPDDSRMGHDAGLAHDCDTEMRGGSAATHVGRFFFCFFVVGEEKKRNFDSKRATPPPTHSTAVAGVVNEGNERARKGRGKDGMKETPQGQ